MIKMVFCCNGKLTKDPHLFGVKKNRDEKITEKTCSHGTLKNRISKLEKIGVIL